MPWKKKTFINSFVEVEFHKKKHFWPWNLENYKHFFRSKFFYFLDKEKNRPRSSNKPNRKRHEKTDLKRGYLQLKREDFAWGYIYTLSWEKTSQVLAFLNPVGDLDDEDDDVLKPERRFLDVLNPFVN